jgi:hypothetical protein
MSDIPTPYLNDQEIVERSIRSITSSEEEYDALRLAVELRALAMVRHPHFRALHRHVMEALLRDGELALGTLRCEIQRGEFRYQSQTKPIEEFVRVA